jgi:hypothetical protein
MLNNTTDAIIAHDEIKGISALDDMLSFYSDRFKEIHGIRPRWIYDWNMRTVCAEIDLLDLEEIEAPQPTAGEGWSYTGGAL